MTNLDKYYDILGLQPGATQERIKQSYRDLVNVWHPDRFAHSPRLQLKAQEKLKEINEAYSHLKGMGSDSYARSRQPEREPQYHQPSYESAKSRPSQANASPQTSPPKPKKRFAIWIIASVGIVIIWISIVRLAAIFRKPDSSLGQPPLDLKPGQTIGSPEKPPEYPKTEEGEFLEILNNPKLDIYLTFIDKYPLSSKKDELISTLVLANPNLPPQNYWHIIRENNRGYWELNYKNIIWLVWIPKGTLIVKTSPEQKDNQVQELTQETEVEIRGFWIGKYEVTVEQYKNYCNENSISFDDRFAMENEPIRNISWNEAAMFCEWLSCRLPTELEWERASRAGENYYNYPWGNNFDSQYCNISSNSIKEVGKFKDNEFGLFDIIGNVEEWCQNYYSENILSNKNQALYKVLRGGSFQDDPSAAIINRRNYMFPAYKKETYGFRIAMD